MAMEKVVVDGAFERVVLAVKTAYCSMRRQAQRIEKFWPTDEKWDRYWRGAAMLCVNHRLSPWEFIEVQFYALRPWPDIPVISSGKALDRFYRHRRPCASEKAVEVTVQLDVFDQLVGSGRSPEDVLTDTAQQFDPLFTFALATSYGLDDLVEQNKEEALARYSTSVYYDELYKELIPDEFRGALGRMMERGTGDVDGVAVSIDGAFDTVS